MSRLRGWLFCGGLLAGGGTLLAARLGAQALSGRVVDGATRRPLSGIPVVLLRATPDDTAASAAAVAPAGTPDRTPLRRDATALATTVTGADGVFLLTAPLPGAYRVRIGAEYVAPPVTLATAESFETREYLLAVAPAAASPTAPTVASARESSPPACSSAALQAAMADGSARTAAEDTVTGVQALLASLASRGVGPTLCEFQVEKQASTVRGSLWARYPDELRRGGGTPTDGRVVAQFVIDEHGRADMATFRILEASDPVFVAPVWEGVSRAVFSPAEIAHHHKVRQLVQLPFTFTLNTVARRGGP